MFPAVHTPVEPKYICFGVVTPYFVPALPFVGHTVWKSLRPISQKNILPNMKKGEGVLIGSWGLIAYSQFFLPSTFGWWFEDLEDSDTCGCSWWGGGYSNPPPFEFSTEPTYFEESALPSPEFPTSPALLNQPTPTQSIPPLPPRHAAGQHRVGLWPAGVPPDNNN